LSQSSSSTNDKHNLSGKFWFNPGSFYV
jgi:hypothetical protein